MTDDTKQEIEDILSELENARQKAEKYYTKNIKEGSEFDAEDFFEMARAIDKEKLLMINYELMLSESFPQHYTRASISELKQEKAKLEDRLDSWQKKQIPRSVA